MMKIFISQIMNGVPRGEIIKRQRDAKEYLEEVLGTEVEIVDNYFDDDEEPDLSYDMLKVWYMSQSLLKLSTADAIFFLHNSHLQSPGCMLEHIIANTYNLQIIYDKREE